MGRLHHMLACYRGTTEDNEVRLNKAYQVIVKKLENKNLYNKEIFECQHLIFWPGSQGRVHCHTTKLEPNWRVSVDEVPLLVKSKSHKTCQPFVPPNIVAGSKTKRALPLIN
jgi:hypothetical protein